MRKRRRLPHELATDRTGQHQPHLTIGDSGLRAALDRYHLLRIEPVVDPGAFMDRKVYLGEIFTDAAARLLVLGGRGVSASHDGSPAKDFANKYPPGPVVPVGNLIRLARETESRNASAL
jgi:hypothetical protein